MTNWPSWVEGLVAAFLFFMSAMATQAIPEESFAARTAAFAGLAFVLWGYESIKGARTQRMAEAQKDVFDLFCTDFFSQAIEAYEEANQRLPYRATVTALGPLSRLCYKLHFLPPIACLRQVLVFNLEKDDPDYGLRLWRRLKTGQGVSWLTFTSGQMKIWRRPNRGRAVDLGLTKSQQEKTNHIVSVMSFPLRRDHDPRVIGVLNIAITRRDEIENFEAIIESLKHTDSDLRAFANRLSRFL